MQKEIYLDYNSTTPVDYEVLQAMLPWFSENFGNAASRTHAYGWRAEAAVNKARAQTASLFNCEENEIIFTSGATEAINLAIKGVAEAYHVKGKHIVTISTEHSAVLDTCSYLEKKGAEVTILPVMSDGLVDIELLSSAIRNDTILVCVMLANNETGVIQPVEKIAKVVHEKGSLLFSDTTQAAGKIHVDVNEMHIDLACISAHKMYGPKGTGALFVRRKDPRVTLLAQMHGGGHERGLRSGTLNVPGIVGMGLSCELAGKQLWDNAAKMSVLRSKLEQKLTEDNRAFVNGNIKNRLPNTTNLCFPGIRAEELIRKFPSLAIATGSACSSALPKPSHVLTAMGLSEKDAYSSLRISLGKNTTEEEINSTLTAFESIGDNI